MAESNPRTYEDKFIAFVDILGFSDLVRESQEEKSGRPTLEELIDLVEKLGSQAESARLAQSGPHVCPRAPFVSRDLSFRITQVSDSVVVSSEVSPAGVIHLVNHCFGISVDLLMSGHLCRGFITRVQIFHSDSQFIGSGYLSALDGEKRVSVFQANSAEIGTPFIQFDKSVCTYVAQQTDECVKMLFGRMTESDGRDAAITAFAALKRLPSTVIDENFDPREWKEKILITRTHMQKLVAQLEKVALDAPRTAQSKIAHYIRKLGEVLAVKNQEIEYMDRLATELPRKPR
jgi:hypothetical protein